MFQELEVAAELLIALDEEDGHVPPLLGPQGSLDHLAKKAERWPVLARGESSSSSAITGGVDPAVKGARPFVGPLATAGVPHQDHRHLPPA